MSDEALRLLALALSNITDVKMERQRAINMSIQFPEARAFWQGVADGHDARWGWLDAQIVHALKYWK